MAASRRSFTLLEILIVVVLIGMASGVAVVQIPKLLKGESFERGVEQVVSKILLAQELMLDFDTDVSLSMEIMPSKGLRVTLTSLHPVPEKIKRVLNRYSLIKGIEECKFNDSNEFKLLFDRTLGASPRGTLILKGAQKRVELCLKGFPSKPLKDESIHDPKEALYPEEVLSIT